MPEPFAGLIDVHQGAEPGADGPPPRDFVPESIFGQQVTDGLRAMERIDLEDIGN